MVQKFQKFSKALAEDPSTRRIWYAIATSHDFESHDKMTESNLYQKILKILGTHVPLLLRNFKELFIH